MFGRQAGSSQYKEQLDLALGDYDQLTERQAALMARLVEMLESSGGGAKMMVGPIIQIGGSPHQTRLQARPTTYGIPVEPGDPIHAERGRLFMEEPPEIATEIDFGWANLDNPNGRLQYEEPPEALGLNIGRYVHEAWPAFAAKAGLRNGDLVLATPYMDDPNDYRRAKLYSYLGMGPMDVNKMQSARLLNSKGQLQPELLNEAHPKFTQVVQAILNRRKR